ncbi:hypothetical protein SAMN06265348_102223 [Pedobacter westerhofensis]|uniref:Lipoprotein n=1 Tax=Pedobacter westerhofensis TaxID=425512 RepID=A0A521BEB6_9SPHI|nr:hypothetical protein [Pedobacter westerhofensis]SMO45311.1 hypothetical protein SAMN06265348_102223 [Pedobacter westerhofensis]
MKYLLIIMLFLTSCTYLTDDDLNSFVDAQLRNSKKGVLDFRNFKYKGWNKMYILAPHAAAAGFDDTLLKSEDEILGTGISKSDSFFLIVLAKNTRVVRIARFSPSGISKLAIMNDKFGFYPKSTAVFNYRTAGNLKRFNAKETEFKHFSSDWPESVVDNIK